MIQHLGERASLAMESASIIAVVSAERFMPYLTACEGDSIKADQYYRWGSRIASAFFELVGQLEVATRNSMDRQLSHHFRRADWWDAPALDPHFGTVKKIDAAKARVARRRSATRDHMIEELSFGFWVALLGQGGRGKDYETKLWRPALHNAFPGYHGKRAELHKDFDHVREFRNKIAHHESICRRHLAKDRETILRLAGYVSQEALALVQGVDRVPEVLATCPIVVPRQRSSGGG